MTHPYVSHDSVIYVVCRIHMPIFFFLILSYRVVPQRIAHLYVSHDSFIRVP